MNLRKALTAAVTAASLLAPLTARADATVDLEAKRLTDSRKSERYTVDMGKSIRAGGAMIEVNAPMSVVRHVVTQYGHYASFMPGFQKSRVVAKKDGMTDVYLQVPILHGAATVWSLTRFSPIEKEGENGERIDGRMIEGNIDDLHAVWHLRPVDDTHTVVKFELLLVPKLPLPGSVVTPELAFAADQAVTSTRDRSEARAKAEASTAQNE